MRASNGIVGMRKRFSYNARAMKKNAPLAFRIPEELKKKLQTLARDEARSLSQICELLLAIGIEEYEREGHTYLQRVLSRSHRDKKT